MLRILARLNRSNHSINKTPEDPSMPEIAIRCLLLFTVFLTIGASTEQDPFHPGTTIPEFGRIATVDADVELPASTKFKVTFDSADQAGLNAIDRTFDSAARFINLHTEAGVPAENIELAIVVHGGASLDVTDSEFHKARNEVRENASAGAIETLQNNNVRFFICGQSAAYHQIGKENLLPGIQLAHSAMTMHALLQQDGYTLNPF